MAALSIRVPLTEARQCERIQVGCGPVLDEVSGGRAASWRQASCSFSWDPSYRRPGTGRALSEGGSFQTWGRKSSAQACLRPCRLVHGFSESLMTPNLRLSISRIECGRERKNGCQIARFRFPQNLRCLAGSQSDQPVPNNKRPLWQTSFEQYEYTSLENVSAEGVSGLQAIQCSMTKAFSSMVLMLKALQSYALQMRSMLYYEDFESVAHVIHKEMQASLLWLFQQVFACTPMLMVAVMVLFSDFTVHSASSNVSLTVSLPQAIPAHAALMSSLEEVYVGTAHFDQEDPQASDGTPAIFGGAYGGKGGRYQIPMFFSSFDDEKGVPPQPLRGIHEVMSDESAVVDRPESDGANVVDGNPSLIKLLESTAREMELHAGKPAVHLRLDPEVVRLLVSPISIELEEDNYVCFDRTDLQYQEVIEDDPTNPMLLSNYAQFLYIVRRDYDRSEAYFHRALREAPTDGAILGRFAAFLWLGRKDKDAAERAFKAAIASDPENPYYSGSYAHFLWHSGDDDETCPYI